jgi:hypothetical protein
MRHSFQCYFGEILSTDRGPDPIAKLGGMQRCIGIIERCKSLQGRRYRPALARPLPAESSPLRLAAIR